jgi:DNA polymerase-3 subunit delta
MIIAFVGDNSHAREQAAREFIDSFSSVYGATAIDRFDGETLDDAQLKDAISTLPFLSPRRLVLVRDLSANKSLADKLETIVDELADTTDLVIIENRVDHRGKYLNILKKLADFREFEHLEGEQLINWLIDQTFMLGGKITAITAQSLVDRVGTNHQLLINELSKLVLYQPEITALTIQLLTSYSPQSSIFAMLDAAFAGDVSMALKLYNEQRAQGMQPQAILGMIAWQLHALSVVKAAGQMSQKEIAERSRLSPFVIRKNMPNTRRISEHQLLSLLDQAIQTDKRLKTTSVNPDDALQALIMSF